MRTVLQKSLFDPSILENSSTLTEINRSMSLVTRSSWSGSSFTCATPCNPAISRLTITSLNLSVGRGFCDEKKSTSFVTSSLNESWSHSSRPSSTQKVVPRSGSWRSFLNMIQRVSRDDKMDWTFSGVSKYDKTCLARFGRFDIIWYTNPLRIVIAVLRFSS